MKSMRKNDSLTWIQVIACVAVLMLHTNGCFWNFSATQMYWKSANIIECFFYFAVPLFFMISGITMMDFYDRYTLREYFIKRGKKTVLPFLGWSCIGLFWGMARGQILVSDLNVSYVAKGIMDAAFVPNVLVLYAFVHHLSLYAFICSCRKEEKKACVYLSGCDRFYIEFFDPVSAGFMQSGMDHALYVKCPVRFLVLAGGRLAYT